MHADAGAVLRAASRSGCRRCSMASRSNTAGRSKKTTWRSVTTKSCIITERGQVDVDAADERAGGVGDVEAQEGRERAVAEEAAARRWPGPLGMGGHRARRARRRSPTRRRCRASAVSSVGAPPSIRARMRPAWRMTWVLAVFFIDPGLADHVGVGEVELRQAAEQRPAGLGARRSGRGCGPSGCGSDARPSPRR